jgi:outer membrane protein insertion porin family
LQEDGSLFDQLYDTPDTAQEWDDEHDDTDATQSANANPYEGHIINQVTVEGNQFISNNAILNYVPYQAGIAYTQTPFIKKLYLNLKQLHHVQVEITPHNATMVNIVIRVQEKVPITNIVIEKNYHLQTKDILTQIGAEKLTAADQQELAMLALKIEALYKQKGYFFAKVDTILTYNDQNQATATFTIQEGIHSTIKKIQFKGNKHIAAKELRAALLTKEEWLLSFLDKTGSYNEERARYGDTQVIEQLYQNRGFLRAKVTDVSPHMNHETGAIELVYTIQEGQQFTISSITVDESEEFDNDRLLFLTGIRSGQLYSKQAVSDAIKRLESLWAHQGYIFTHVDPVIIPNEKESTVSVHFAFEPGKKMTLNRLIIKGNKKTIDKVIRRKILLQEGQQITQGLLNQSKQNVQALGYFEQRDGLAWKIKRLDDENADIDLIVKESKTGHFGLNLGYGGNGKDMSSPLTGFTVKVDFVDTNLVGSGVNFNLAASWAQEEQTVMLHLAQPWLFDKPILGALDVYHKRPSYDELRHLQNGPVNEKLTGGALTAGYILHSDRGLFHDTQLFSAFGIDSVRYQKKPEARSFGTDTLGTLETTQYQSILNQSFTPGDYAWISCNMEQDMRSHPFFPKEGHRWKLSAKVAAPTFNRAIGFYKFSFDTHWYTTLIDQYDLVLHAHAFAGIAAPLKKYTIPFGELFHIGGPATVRGFRFGEIGPKFLNESGIGAKKALFVNVELLFPITADYSMKGVIFYDGGTGWDNPYVHSVEKPFVTHNSFDYRHSVGVGIRLTNPMPIRIDWGFKIDPRKDRTDRSKDENGSEVHFSMSYDW